MSIDDKQKKLDLTMEDANETSISIERKSLAKRIFQLVLCIVIGWFFIFVFTPGWVSHSKIHQDFMSAVDEFDIPVTATYYNDLPFINDAYIMMLDSWRYAPKGAKFTKKITSKTRK